MYTVSASKIGFYVTPGISDQAVADKSPIKGTSDTANEIADGASEHNYNCGGMQGIDYSKPGAQAFINSWADELASWGADYVKLDGVGTGDIGDIEAWSAALEQTGRPIRLELSNNLSISDASTWAEYSNGWRTGGDIHCYCGSPFPLTQCPTCSHGSRRWRTGHRMAVRGRSTTMTRSNSVTGRPTRASPRQKNSR